MKEEKKVKRALTRSCGNKKIKEIRIPNLEEVMEKKVNDGSDINVVTMYIYLGYKEVKHMCREVNPYGKPSYVNSDSPHVKELYEMQLRRWQAAESQLKEYEIENEVIGHTREFADFKTTDGCGIYLLPKSQFSGELISGKVRIV